MKINVSKKYDLDARTMEFGKRIIKLVKSLSKNTINDNLGNQVMRSGTSIGANYREANESQTKKDFAFKIGICRKEAKETVFWLNLIIEANPELKNRMKLLLNESEELVKIFGAISQKCKKF